MIATSPPAQIGMPLEMVDTPALLIDLDAYEKNNPRDFALFRRVNLSR